MCGGTTRPSGVAPLAGSAVVALRVRLLCFFLLLEAEVLEEAGHDHGHEHMAMQTRPGASLELVEAKFLLHSLVGLLAGPSGLDGGRQFLKARVGWQVELLSLGRAYPRGSKCRCQWPFRFPPPGDAAPCDVLKRLLGRYRILAGHRMLARPTGAGLGTVQVTAVA
jgi:hypothetical protein